MWAKAHKIFFAAILLSKIPSLTKKDFKKYGFSGADCQTIVQLANQFKTGEILSSDKIHGCLAALEKLTKNQVGPDINFLIFCEFHGRLNANALSYLCNNSLYKDANARTPIFLVSAKGTREDAEQLVKAGTQVDVRDKYGYIPLTLACINNNIAVAAVLLEQGADPNSKDKEGATPLHFAAQLGHTSLFSLLIERGARVDAQSGSGMTPFDCAVLAGHFDSARQLAKQYHCKIDSANNLGQTLLQSACIEYNNCLENNKFSEAEKIYQRIDFLLSVGANANREYPNPLGKDKLNYFVQTMLVRIEKNKLHELDYQLARLFALRGFDFAGHMLTDEHSLLSYIVHSKNIRLIKSCGLAGDDVKNVVEIPSSMDKTGYMFTTMKLTDHQQTLVANWFSPILDEILTSMYSELHQVMFNDLDSTEQEAPPKNRDAAVIAANVPHAEAASSMLKQQIANAILNILSNYFKKFETFSQFNMPNWCKDITIEKLMLKSIDSLNKLKERIEEWGEATLRRITANSPNYKDKFDTNAAVPEVVKKEPEVAVYEGAIQYSTRLMKVVSDNYCLLLPFDQNGNMGLDVICDAKRISDDDRVKFERVIANPVVSRNPNQPGIRFLTDSNYTCRVYINGKEYIKLIVAEIKISDSPNRIALYCLSQQGQGKKVLVLGPYVDGGFHDVRYEKMLFQAHPLKLTKEFVSTLETRISSVDVPSVAPPAALSFLKPASNRNMVVSDDAMSPLVPRKQN